MDEAIQSDFITMVSVFHTSVFSQSYRFFSSYLINLKGFGLLRNTGSAACQAALAAASQGPEAAKAAAAACEDEGEKSSAPRTLADLLTNILIVLIPLKLQNQGSKYL